MIFHKYRRLFAPILVPLSLLYGFGVAIRNKLFDLNVLKSVEFNIPLISVGNITVGGTGKTPHVEYLIELLKDKFKIGILSRGYKRITKGFLMARKGITPDEIGDESYQIFSKYNDIHVAVDEKRVNGIVELRKTKKDLQVILLDDAFQHRYVKPGVSILLIDYYRPVFKDFLLPYGELREGSDAIRRAHIVIVTKVPDSIKPIEMRLWKKELKLFPYQYLYFTKYSYGDLTPVFKGKNSKISLSEIKKQSFAVLLITGIANPEPLANYIREFTRELIELHFPDHYSYTRQDSQQIQKKFEMLKSVNKIILTTEKDAVKLNKIQQFKDSYESKIFYLPVKVEFLDDSIGEFDSNIISYVTKNKKINRLYK